MKQQQLQIRKVEKRRRCLSDREIASIAVRVFNGERRQAIAREIGVSASYLSRLLDDARARGVFRIVVATPEQVALRAQIKSVVKERREQREKASR